MAVCDGYGNLKPNTIYQLVEVGTVVEEDETVGVDEDDEEEDEEEETTKPS